MFFSGDKYAYRAFLETELNFGNDAKRSQLQSGMYYPDIYKDGFGGGFKERMRICKDSQWVEVIAPLHADLFLQNRFLLSQCDLRIELYRNTDQFCLVDTTGQGNVNYKLDIQKMCMYMKKVEISDDVNVAIETMLQRNSAKYPIRRTQITTIHITENRRSTPLNSLFTGILPRRLVVGLVSAEGSRGSYKTCPFHFKPFSIAEIKIVSGTTTVPSTPLKLDFSRNMFKRAFTQLFEGIGIANEDKGNDISIERFQNGSTFFVFELGADGADTSNWDLFQEGSTSLEILFSDALPASGIDCIIYAEFDSLVMIDYARNVFFDYTV